MRRAATKNIRVSLGKLNFVNTVKLAIFLFTLFASVTADQRISLKYELFIILTDCI